MQNTEKGNLRATCYDYEHNFTLKCQCKLRGPGKFQQLLATLAVAISDRFHRSTCKFNTSISSRNRVREPLTNIILEFPKNGPILNDFLVLRKQKMRVLVQIFFLRKTSKHFFKSRIYFSTYIQ